MRQNTVFVIALAMTLAWTACSQNKKAAAASPIESKKEKIGSILPSSVSGEVAELSASDFRKKVMDYEAHPQEWVYEGSRPVIIDFYATWCRPCKMTAPVVEQLAKDYAGKVDFYKVDIDKEQELAAVFGIQSIPTFLFIPMKGKPTMQMGDLQREELERIIKEMMGEN